MLRKSLAWIVALLLLLAPLSICRTAAAQRTPARPDQDQDIKLKAEIVEFRVVVTDKKGQLIEDLKQDDFEIIDNGKAQPISFFSVERVKRDSRSKAAEDKSAEPATAAAAPPPSRAIVLFVDTLHLSTFSFMRVKRQLREFIDEQITDQDLVALVVSSGSLGILQQFMRDKRMLKYAVEKITPFPRGNSLFTPYLAADVMKEIDQAILVALRILYEEENYTALSQDSARAYVMARARQILAEEDGFRRATLLTLRAVSEQLAAMAGQRLLILFSDGFTMQDSSGGADNQTMQSVTGRAARSGVVIYALDAKGLTAPAEFSATTQGGGANPNLGFYASASESDQQSALKTLAEETGGRAFVNRNDLKAPLAKILDDNKVYYVIAFYPEQAKDKKKFRNVSIRVKNRPDYVVRAQKGYMPFEALKEGKEDLTPRQKLLKAMLAPLPVTNIAVTASADYLERETDDAQVSIQAHFDARQLQHKQDGQNYMLNCEVVVAVYNLSGKMIESFAETIKGSLTPEQVEQARQKGYRFDNRLRLKPGLYQVRLGVRDVDSDLTGTSFTWVEVPDLSKGRLAMSSLFLGKGRNEEPAAAVGGGQKSAAPKLILGRASFKSGETCFYRFAVYNAEGEASAAGATVKVEIFQADKAVYQGDWQPLSTRTIRKDRKGLEAGGELKLGLEPGIYELRVTVRDAKAKKSEQRVAHFEVE